MSSKVLCLVLFLFLFQLKILFRSLSELLEAEKNAKESYRTKLIDRSKELEVSRIEFEKALRSLENEKTVLTAAVEARERKLDNLKELKDTVKSLTQKLQEKEEECNKMVRHRSHEFEFL